MSTRRGPTPRPKITWQCAVCGWLTPDWVLACKRCAGHATLARRRHAHEEIDLATTVLGTMSLESVAPFSSGVAAWDQLTEGGVPPSTVTLLGGDAGTGKSTLLLSVACRAHVRRALYVSGEEPRAQIELRLRRLDLHEDNLASERCRIVTTNSTEEMFEWVDRLRPQLVICDSVQSMESLAGSIKGKVGSASQVRYLTMKSVRHARATGTAWLLVGQVNQNGKLAGPNKMKHWVDATALLKKNDRNGDRVIRMLKSRYCAAHAPVKMIMSRGGLLRPDEAADYLRRTGLGTPSATLDEDGDDAELN